MHTDPELLGLLALGEQVGTTADLLHLQTCPECAGELAELTRVVTLGRSDDAQMPLLTPSPQLWDRIRAELGLSPAPELPAAEPERPHLRWSELTGMHAALAGPAGESAGELTAQVNLSPAEASWSKASGEAVLATDGLGRRILQLALQADLPNAGVRQAWLVHGDDPTLRQSLGILDGPFGVWTVDQSIDLQQYRIIEISQQSVGTTEHSGDTIVRGQLLSVA